MQEDTRVFESVQNIGIWVVTPNGDSPAGRYLGPKIALRYLLAPLYGPLVPKKVQLGITAGENVWRIS